MTHQQVQDNEVVEQYVRHKLAPAERQAFQEHFFECDECFEQVESTARFVAGVREASRAGVLAAAGRAERPHVLSRLLPAVLMRPAGRWAVPALAASLLVALTLASLWASSRRREEQLRRENQLLAERASEQNRASERLQVLEAKIRELEAGDSASQEQKESLREEVEGQKEALRKEVVRLKEQLAAAERRRETDVARLSRPEINVPVINLYPVGDALRTGRIGESSRQSVPGGARTFVLILGDYEPGYTDYRLEIRDPSGRLVATRAGLKPDQSGELSVMLNRTLLSRNKYRLKLYGQRRPIAEYVIEVE